METLVWEGVVWERASAAHYMGFPVKCDGCGAKIETGALFHGDDGSSALWCRDCVAIVRAEQRQEGGA